MPLFDYKCPYCGSILEDVFIDQTHMKDGKPTLTGERALIADLDSLPFPAISSHAQ